MAIRKYTSTADTTITNAYKSGMTTTGTDANMGQSDILEVFSIYAQADETSSEQARILINFPIDEITADIAADKVPSSNVKYYLKLFNAPHSSTLPVNFSLFVHRMTTDWEEGYGLDMEEYSDIGADVVSLPISATAGAGDVTILDASSGGTPTAGGGVGDIITIVTPNNTIVATQGICGSNSGEGTNVSTFCHDNDVGVTASNLAAVLSPHLDLIAVQGTGSNDHIVTITQVNTGSGTSLTFVDLCGAMCGENKLVSYTDGTNFIPTTFTGTGATWNTASSQADWTADGGDYSSSAGEFVIASFEEGYEEMEVDVTDIVNNWINGQAATAGVTFVSFPPTFAVTTGSITLVSTDTTSKTYTASSSGNDFVNNLFSDGSEELTPEASSAAAAGFLQDAIEDINGHNGKIIVTNDNEGGLTFTQAVGGLAGNTAIVFALTSALPTSIFDDGTDANPNYGFMIKLEGSQETATMSYYTKKFFARGTEFFFEKPIIEARWDSSEKDDHGNFYVKSNLRNDADNTNTILLKNYVNGALKNIPDPDTNSDIVPTQLDLKFYESVAKTFDQDLASNVTVTMSNPSTGVYQADVIIDTSIGNVYACWQTCYAGSANGTADGCGTGVTGEIFTYHEEYIKTKSRPVGSEKIPTYVSAIQNLKNVYSRDETARFRVFARLKDWSPTIYTIATKKLEPEIVEKAYYRVVRVVDDLIVVDYGTETPEHTKLSYDKDGSYFDLDMSMLEPGWAYRIELMYSVNGELHQQPETFKFRVE